MVISMLCLRVHVHISQVCGKLQGDVYHCVPTGATPWLQYMAFLGNWVSSRGFHGGAGVREYL